MRTHYKNGEEIALSCGCNSCSPLSVNGRLVHEAGCPDRWKDVPVPCWGCGFNHYAPSRYALCESCADQGGEE